ncbi:MAG: helix-turn-helix domain-containing protein [Burkholderiales bacterium]|nr:MAG: helix-turn-helix domain-containing protein [Burkholderiales bacterium]
MDERLRFVARLLEGEKMAEPCREFDISRKTGYKIFQRYKDLGLEGLTDRSRRPSRTRTERQAEPNRAPVPGRPSVAASRRYADPRPNRFTCGEPVDRRANASGDGGPADRRAAPRPTLQRGHRVICFRAPGSARCPWHARRA